MGRGQADSLMLSSEAQLHLRRLGEVLLRPTVFLQAVVCLTDLEGTDWASYSVLRWLDCHPSQKLPNFLPLHEEAPVF